MGDYQKPEGQSTVRDVQEFAEFMGGPGGSREDLAGALMVEVQRLDLGKLALLKTQYPKYASALEKAVNLGKAEGELHVRARGLLALLHEDDSSVNLSELVTLVRRTRVQK